MSKEIVGSRHDYSNTGLMLWGIDGIVTYGDTGHVRDGVAGAAGQFSDGDMMMADAFVRHEDTSKSFSRNSIPLVRCFVMCFL